MQRCSDVYVEVLGWFPYLWMEGVRDVYWIWLFHFVFVSIFSDELKNLSSPMRWHSLDVERPSFTSLEVIHLLINLLNPKLLVVKKVGALR